MASHGGAGTISVVVPSYNHGRFLRATLASALDQTLPPDEIVVVDDGSSDDSPEILRSADDPRLRVEVRENRGAHDAINRAIELSSGDYVAILNSDDLLEPERLEHAWGVARSTGALLVCGEVRLIGDDGRDPPADHDIVRWYETARRLGREAPSLSAALRRHNVAVTTSNFFLHRALWAQLGGFRSWRYVHDYDFILRAVRLCPARVRYEPALRDVRYRVHGANTISESHDRALAERGRMLRELRAPASRMGAAWQRMTSRAGLAAAVAGVGILRPVRLPSASEPTAHEGDIVGAERPSAGSGGAGRPTIGIVVRTLDVGGLEEVVALLAESLPTVGVDVRVHCLEDGGAIAERLRREGVSVSVGDGSVERCVEWAQEERVHVVSGHHTPVGATQGLALAGTPVVETLHNTFAWYSADDWEAERERHEYVAGMVGVSETVVAYYERRAGYRAGTVIPNAVHPGRVQAVPRVFARRLLGLSGAGPVYVAVGRLARQKNLSGMLAAFSRVHRAYPGARLLLAGPGDATVSLSKLRAGAPDVFAAGAVRWLGTRADVGTVLSAADAYVSAAFYEGWSVAASEAAWIGRPLLLSDVGGARELVGSVAGAGPGPRGRVVVHPCGDALTVDEQAIDVQEDEARAAHEVELAEAMLEVAEDVDGWREREEEIRAWARSTLPPSAMARRYATVLRAAAVRARPE